MNEDDENKNLEEDQSPSDGQEDATSEDNSEEKSEEERQPSKKSAEARIQELIAENKRMQEKVSDLEVRMAPPPPTQAPEESDPKIQKAVKTLKELGFATKEEIAKVKQDIEDRASLNADHMRFESRYDGSDGRPQYDRKEIEKYMKEHFIYDPEAAYKLKFEKELFDHELKKYEGDRKKPFVQKPGMPAGNRNDNAITREKIAEWLKTPEGRLKYEQNRDKILKMLANKEL